jgi:hypothetical protein
VNKIENLIIKEFKEVDILDAIESVRLFTKFVVDAENVIVWLESTDNQSTESQNINNFWSFNQDGNYIYLKQEIINNFMKGNNDTLILNQEDDFKEFSTLLNSFGISKIKSIALRIISIPKYKETMVLQVINKKGNNNQFLEKDLESIKLASLFATQTLQIKNISALTKYYFEEQEKAYNKQKTIIHNDFTNSQKFQVDIFYQPSDILSGDSYSLYQTVNGDILVYVVDAMGHGISPSLTAYSTSSIIKHSIKNSSSFEDLMKNLLDNVQNILTDEEQLTCGFFWFSKDLKTLQYIIAGMYPALILDGNEIISAKANNIPFMNFAIDFSISTIELKDFQKLLIYTDGLVEDTQEIDVNIEKLLMNDDYTIEVFEKLDYLELEDDTTILKFVVKNEHE